MSGSCFHMGLLEWMDGWMDGWMVGWFVGWLDGLLVGFDGQKAD